MTFGNVAVTSSVDGRRGSRGRMDGRVQLVLVASRGTGTSRIRHVETIALSKSWSLVKLVSIEDLSQSFPPGISFRPREGSRTA